MLEQLLDSLEHKYVNDRYSQCVSVARPANNNGLME